MTVLFLLLCFNCTTKEEMLSVGFTKTDPQHTGISFVNRLTESDTFNYFTYPYIYMGGGVAIADFNNDDLQDIYFTGNMVDDKIYLNKGEMQFEDVTAQSEIGTDRRWHTGVTVVDINNDGLQDIYVSVSGPQESKENLLYVNQGNFKFEEQAELFGIADNGNSIQSTFFDYDNDGDLDLYIANYPITSFRTPNFKYRYMMSTITEENSDRLYRNEGDGTFVDVTRNAGVLSFGLSISATVADFNNDGWQDIYVSNDFSTPDYFYINNGDGTFSEGLKTTTKQTSFYSMGADAADFNNDGLMDFFQVDMSAEDNRRSKANMASMDVSLFWSTVNSGFHYQYMYNTLQLNRGIDNNLPVMSNVAAFAGVTSTDWSWAPLFADFNNDGWKDLFVSNGTRREINNKDYFNSLETKINKLTSAELLEASLNIPSEPVANYLYLNNQKLGFDNAAEDWGIDQKGFSNGCAYGDLDNDGDIDLVVNNIDSISWIYENKVSGSRNASYLRVQLNGNASNASGIGSKISVYQNGSLQMNELMLTRGFQSAVEPISHFGLGDKLKVDSVTVKWTDGSISTVYDIDANQTISIDLNSGKEYKDRKQISNPYFTTYDSSVDSLYTHKENTFNDYAFQVLMPHKMSNLGPALAKGDVNGDGLEDVFIGGAMNQAGQVFLQTAAGDFRTNQIFDEVAIQENIDAIFFDADNDGDQDLYVVNGGNEFDSASMHYQDRLYLNENGVLVSTETLPKFYSSGSCVRPFDFDNDGDLDLFIGGRLSPRHYPFPGTSHILVNTLETGQLSFEDRTKELAPTISSLGMITDATWMDVDEDGKSDLIVTGEWMNITWYRNEGNGFDEPAALVENNTGWWFSLEKGDFDNDGDEDLIAGNLGLNYKYKASEDEPFEVFVKDFDQNGKDDIILSYYNFGSQFPVRGRQCSSQQIPAIKSAYKDYSTFSTATVQDIFGTDALTSSLNYSVTNFASSYLENTNGTFNLKELPELAQLAPVNDIQLLDVNKDGNLDALLVGNLYVSEVETPRADAGIGLLLLGDGTGSFETVPMNKSGVQTNYDSKHAVVIKVGNRNVVAVANNNGPMQFLQLN